MAKISDPNIILSSAIESALKKYMPCQDVPSLYKISRHLFSPFWPYPPPFGFNAAAILTPWGYAYLKGKPWPPKLHNFYSKTKTPDDVDCEAEKSKICTTRQDTPSINSEPFPEGEE